jgi:hypothetical protein
MLGHGNQFSTNATRPFFPNGIFEVVDGDVAERVVVAVVAGAVVETMVDVLVVAADVVDGDDPHAQSSADVHWQFLIVGSNIVPTAHKIIGSVPAQQLKKPRQSILPGQSAGAAVSPCRFLSAQKAWDDADVVVTLVCGWWEDVVDVTSRDVDNVVVLGKAWVVLVGEGEVAEPHCQSNNDDHWQTLRAGSYIVPTAHKSIGSFPCQQLK